MGKPSKTDNGNNSLEKKDMTGDSSVMKEYMEREIFFSSCHKLGTEKYSEFLREIKSS